MYEWRAFSPHCLEEDIDAFLSFFRLFLVFRRRAQKWAAYPALFPLSEKVVKFTQCCNSCPLLRHRGEREALARDGSDRTVRPGR